jgi:hypothetical protein
MIAAKKGIMGMLEKITCERDHDPTREKLSLRKM